MPYLSRGCPDMHMVAEVSFLPGAPPLVQARACISTATPSDRCFSDCSLRFPLVGTCLSTATPSNCCFPYFQRACTRGGGIDPAQQVKCCKSTQTLCSGPQCNTVAPLYNKIIQSDPPQGCLPTLLVLPSEPLRCLDYIVYAHSSAVDLRTGVCFACSVSVIPGTGDCRIQVSIW